MPTLFFHGGEQCIIVRTLGGLGFSLSTAPQAATTKPGAQHSKAKTTVTAHATAMPSAS